MLRPPEPDQANDHVAVHSRVAIVTLSAPIPTGTGCHYCRRRATTRDHVVARTRGGLNRWWNLVPACGPCNERKDSGITACACAFCDRAAWMFSLGWRR